MNELMQVFRQLQKNIRADAERRADLAKKPVETIARPTTQIWALPTEVELMRRCSIWDRGYMSRYVWRNGCFVYGAPVIPPHDAYQNKQPYLVSCNDLTDERCPWCGVIGTVIHCSRCGLVVCRGRTTADGFFKCREKCGKTGQTRDGRFTNYGLAL